MGTEANDKRKEEEKAKALAGDPTVKSEDMKDAAIGSESGKKKPEKVEYGDHYTRENRKKVLKPNICYETEGYIYTTDSQGRIKSVEGVLQKGTAKRNSYAQRNVGKGEGRRDGTEKLGKDDGGHLIASIFKGSGDIDNLVPMNANLNRGEWESMEREWADILYNEDGIEREIEVEILPIYKEGDNSKRPIAFSVNYSVDGEPCEPKYFKNESKENR